jgi:hypothetical protein
VKTAILPQPVGMQSTGLKSIIWLSVTRSLGAQTKSQTFDLAQNDSTIIFVTHTWLTVARRAPEQGLA